MSHTDSAALGVHSCSGRGPGGSPGWVAHAMEAARCCEIVADDTQALDVDWGKFHNTWSTPGLIKSSAGARASKAG